MNKDITIKGLLNLSSLDIVNMAKDLDAETVDRLIAEGKEYVEDTYKTFVGLEAFVKAFVMCIVICEKEGIPYQENDRVKEIADYLDNRLGEFKKRL